VRRRRRGRDERSSLRRAASLRSTLASADRFHAAEVMGLRELLVEARSFGLQVQRELETARAVLDDARDELRRAHGAGDGL
jgi:hypothetical protein